MKHMFLRQRISWLTQRPANQNLIANDVVILITHRLYLYFGACPSISGLNLAQATELSRLRADMSKAKQALRLAEGRLTLRESSTSSHDDVRKAVSRLAGDKVQAQSTAAMQKSTLAFSLAADLCSAGQDLRRRRTRPDDP